MDSEKGSRSQDPGRGGDGQEVSKPACQATASWFLELGREEPVTEQETKGQNRGHNESLSINYSE